MRRAARTCPPGHGGFTPGAILAHRYRIIGLPGRGGTGGQPGVLLVLGVAVAAFVISVRGRPLFGRLAVKD